MNKTGPIVLVDDDDDDLHLLIEIFADMSLPNEIHLFRNTSSVITFLQKPEVNPFLIISDINMPILNGFQLRDILRHDPLINHKHIPYIFFSTEPSYKAVSKDPAPSSFQGVFKKPVKHSEWKESLSVIVKYWTLSMPQDDYEL